MELVMSHRILLAEDDHLSAEFIRIALSDEGHDVLAVHSLNDAMTSYADYGPSIVITDIQLGDGSGMNLAKTAKLNGVRTVIGISGFDKAHLIADGNDISHFDQILTKPLELTDLISLVRDAQ